MKLNLGSVQKQTYDDFCDKKFLGKLLELEEIFEMIFYRPENRRIED